MKDPKRFAQEKLEKRAPKGVDPAKHERCVREVKRQGRSVGSAHAICTSSMKKDEGNGSNGDGVSTIDPETQSLATGICIHNRRKLHAFARRKRKLKKSVDFKDTLVSVDATDQLLAETTVNKALLQYVQDQAYDGAKIPFPTGTLTLSKREEGLYHGFFQDRDGQVVEKFDSQTIAIIAKTLQLKSLVPMPAEPTPIPIPVPASEQEVKMLSAAHDRIDMVHNRIDALQRDVIEQVRSKSIRIKYGDFELEIRKSLSDFVKDFRSARTPDKKIVRKAISSWRKKYAEVMPLANDHQAAKELTENWETHQESFCQFVDAISRGVQDEQG